MSEKRPSKKQRELLQFIETFITAQGYGPSYREIMRGLSYRSVSTVAVHVDGLITRGLLRKKDNSARSLEVVKDEAISNSDTPHIAWLKREIKKRDAIEDEKSKKEVIVLKSALEILQDTIKQ